MTAVARSRRLAGPVAAFLVATTLAAPSPARAEAPSPPPPWAAPDHRESPYALRLDVDLPVSLLGLGVWLVPGLAMERDVGGPACDPCDAATLNRLDRLVVGQPTPVARTISDFYFVLPAAFALAAVLDVGVTNWRSWLADLVVVGEALALNGALDEVVRRAVRRPRPFLYTPGVYPDERALPEATLSFYSGHTSAMFTLATSLAYTFHLCHPGAKSRYAVWTAALLLASVEGVLRVVGGAHFPSDVLMGALAGSAVGILVPALHRRPIHLGPVDAALTFAPTFAPTLQPGSATVTGATLGLSGRF